MSYKAVHTIMDTSLKAFAQAESIRVVWEGVGGDATPPYIAPVLLLGTPRQAALGGDAPDFSRGIYQVNVATAPNKGWGEAAGIAEGLRLHFNRKRMESADGGCVVQVDSVEVGPAMATPAAYTLPVSVRFWCMAAAQ